MDELIRKKPYGILLFRSTMPGCFDLIREAGIYVLYYFDIIDTTF